MAESISHGQQRVQRLWDAAAISACDSPFLRIAAGGSKQPQPPTAPFVPRTSNILQLDKTEDDSIRAWMPDKVAGTRMLCVVSGPSLGGGGSPVGPKVVMSTQRIPSDRRIHSVISSSCTRATIMAADDLGNVYSLSRPTASPTGEPSLKRLRSEEGDGWRTVISASDQMPQRGCLPVYGMPGGWVGLHHGAGGPTMCCTREHFMDTRVFDVEVGSIVKSIYHMSAPTSTASVVGLNQNAFLCAEGPLLACYDVRTPAVRSAVHRVTLPSGFFSHVVALGEERSNEVATCSSDRSVIIWDVRNWTRVTTLPAVLKHATMSSTPLSGGRFLVCSGVDSEVRVCTTTPSSTVPTKHATNAHSSSEECGASVSSFRNRINDTEHCESTWHGAWCSLGNTAVGMAITGEFYYAQMPV